MRISLKLLGFSLLFCLSCSDEKQFENLDEIQKIVISVEDFNFEELTRTTLTPTESGAVFTWSVNDTVGIFPETGSQVAFPMSSGAGTNSAEFTGGGWALKSSSSYMAYYPMQGKFYLDKENIKVDYTGQFVKENASTEHLGKYDYMAASASTPVLGIVNFRFKHLGALIRLRLSMEETSTLKSVTLLTDDALFTQQGYVDLTAAVPAVMQKNASNTSNSFQIGLNNIDVDANEELVVYFLIPPVNFSNESLKAVVNMANNEEREFTLPGKNIEAGRPYELIATMVVMVSLDKNRVEITEGDVLKLNAMVKPASALNKNLTWSSSDKTIATVDNTGKVTAIKAGLATITVTAEESGKTSTCVVTVKKPSHGVDINGWEEDGTDDGGIAS